MSQLMTQRLEAIPLECAWHHPDHIRQPHLRLVERPQERLIAIRHNELWRPSMTIELALPRVEKYDARNPLNGPMSDGQKFVQPGFHTTSRKLDIGSCCTRG